MQYQINVEELDLELQKKITTFKGYNGLPSSAVVILIGSEYGPNPIVYAAILYW